jgi:DNA polymerase V
MGGFMRSLCFLVDCNNFYVSCERVFRPELRERPVVVLSNNDGNVVALSNEVKEMGLSFASPFFKVRELIRENRVAVFSSNYTLYGDMSRRVMECLARFAPEMEVYSIDEAFLSPGRMRTGPVEYGRMIRDAVMQWTGIPVSIGIAPTKTLAKLASKIGKRDPACRGVFDLVDSPRADGILEATDVGDVWGVGQQYRQLLHRNGIRTARQLRDTPDKWIRRNMTIMGLRTVWELRGVPCIPFDELPAPKKGIVSSRSFGRPVESIDELREAVAAYVSRAAEKLRAQKSVAGSVTVFLSTNRFKENDPQYSSGISCRLPVPSSYTPRLIKVTGRLLEGIYRRGYQYKKAGVMLYEIMQEGDAQLDLFSRFHDTDRTRRLMRALDGINRDMGRHTLHFAAEGTVRPWQMRREFLSARYTTHWSEIPVVRA